MTRFGGNVMGFQDGRQGRRWAKHGGKCCIEHSRLQHVGPEEANAMGCGPQVGGIHHYRCSDEAFNQVGGLLYCSSASLTRISVLENVDEGRSLVCLDEVDYSDEIVEKI